MKKIEKLFIDYPELAIIRKRIIKSLNKKKDSSFFNLLRDYKIRLSEQDKEAIKALQQRADTEKFLWGIMYCQTFFNGNFYFWYLNLLFKRTKSLPGFSGLIKNLLNAESFSDTLSELEINAFFANYTPSFNPKIKDSSLKLDSRLKLDKREILFEILTPHNTIKADGIVRELKNTVKGKLKEKIVRQIKTASINEKKPVVLFVNISHAGYMKKQIRDAFLGQGQYTLTINNKTGDVVSMEFSRKHNGLVKEESDSQYLSAIVFYSRKIFWFKVDHFEKEIILNHKAKYKLTSNEIKKLKRFDLRKMRN